MLWRHLARPGGPPALPQHQDTGLDFGDLAWFELAVLKSVHDGVCDPPPAASQTAQAAALGFGAAAA